MAENLLTKVWALDFPSPALKLIALAVARSSLRNGACWAKQVTIAQSTGYSRKTVQRGLQDLEDLGWLKRIQRHRDDGGRTSDRIWLTLPQVVLEAETVEQNPDKWLPGGVSESGDIDDPPSDTMSRGASQGDVAPRSQSPRKKSDTEVESSEVRGADAQFSIDGLVEMIWARCGEMGRKRSTKPKVKAALIATLNRRPKDQPLEDRLRLVLSGIDGYLKSPDARKDDGAFEHGAHRTLIGDFWESHATAPRADDPAIDPEIGTLEHPGPALQRRWAEMARDGLPWTVETRGPRPGMHGCRISDEIQVEFGFTPWAPALPAALEESIIDVTPAAPLQLEGPAPAQEEHQVDGDDDAAAFA